MHALLGPWAVWELWYWGTTTLQWWGHYWKSVCSSFNAKRHCLAVTLLSVIILSFSGKLEQNAFRTNFQKSPYPSMLLSGCNHGQKCNLLRYPWTVMGFWLFQSLHISRVVVGKKNSPTVAHTGRKRRPKWVPSAWGYNWAPCLWGL
jgi:hypothetical protein